MYVEDVPVAYRVLGSDPIKGEIVIQEASRPRAVKAEYLWCLLCSERFPVPDLYTVIGEHDTK